MVEKREWRVRCGYRKASAFPAMTPVPTHSDTVIVTAPDYSEARTAAIHATYERHKGIEHVTPLDVVLVELEATHLRGNQYAVRPAGQLGTCGFSPIAWQVDYVTAPNESAAIRKASRAVIFGKAFVTPSK